jgi:hypothetical protein
VVALVALVLPSRRPARRLPPCGDPAGAPPPAALPVVLFVLAALLLNAFVCGALSGPYARYQARIVWLVPLLALGLVLRVRKSRAAPDPARP